MIADGHHRYETALTYQAERRAATGGAAGDYDLVMAFVVELAEGQLSVGPIHRTISGVPADVDLAELFGRWFDTVHAGPADDQLVEAVAESGALALVTGRDVWLLTPREQTYAEAGSDLDSSLVALAVDAAARGRRWPTSTTGARPSSAVTAGEAQAAVLLRPGDRRPDLATGPTPAGACPPRARTSTPSPAPGWCSGPSRTEPDS